MSTHEKKNTEIYNKLKTKLLCVALFSVLIFVISLNSTADDLEIDHEEGSQSTLLPEETDEDILEGSFEETATEDTTNESE